MISCAKHFPGHGDTSTDSHFVLPLVKASKATLFRRELVPFRAAIQSKVPMVMTAHVVYPALDSTKSATLSSLILQDLLRKKLQFKGVVASDDLEMNAFANPTSISEASVEAIRAGVDLLLVCKSLAFAQEIYERIILSVEKRQLPLERIMESLGRMKKMKEVYLRQAFVFDSTHSLPQWEKGWPHHQKLALKIAKAL
jgi:beta-N-acetylhexosaminidase